MANHLSKREQAKTVEELGIVCGIFWDPRIRGMIIGHLQASSEGLSLNPICHDGRGMLDERKLETAIQNRAKEFSQAREPDHMSDAA